MIPAGEEARAQRAEQPVPVLVPSLLVVVHFISPQRRSSRAPSFSFASVAQSKPELQSQASTTARSSTAPGSVPEYRWLNRNRVRGCRAASARASSHEVWTLDESGAVASVMATAAPRTSSSSGGGAAAVAPQARLPASRGRRAPAPPR